MNKTDFLKAAAHPDKVSEHNKIKALEAGAKLLAKQDAQNADNKATMKAGVKHVVHMAERGGALSAASFTKGVAGTADVFGVDVRGLLGGLMTIGSGIAKVAKPKSALADHTLALGEGVLLSYTADKMTEFGQSARAKWDARGTDTPSEVSGQPRQVTVTPPAIGRDARVIDELPSGFVYADAA